MQKVITPGRAFALALLVLAATLLQGAPAAAHTASNHYISARWANGAVHSYGYQHNFPSGAHRSRGTAGKNEWHTHGNSNTPRFNAFRSDSSFNQYENPCNNDWGAVFWEPLGSSGNLGETRRCVVNNRIQRFTIVANSSRSWYTGIGTPSSGQHDLQAMMAHEFGHVTGWSGPGHFSGSTLCPNNSNRHTMCDSMSAGNNWMRHLKTHDAHTFRNAY